MLAQLLQAAPAAMQALGGIAGLGKNPLAGLQNLNLSQFKVPGQDDLYKSISKAYDAIAPQFLNATGAQQDSINQSKADAARNIAASMGRNVGSAVGGRLAGEANASSTQMRAQMEAQRAGAAQSQGQMGHQANVNQMLQKIQAHVQDVTSANQNLLAQSQAPSPMAAIAEGIGGLGSALNAYQTKDDDPFASLLAMFGQAGGGGTQAGGISQDDWWSAMREILGQASGNQGAPGVTSL